MRWFDVNVGDGKFLSVGVRLTVEEKYLCRFLFDNHN